MKLSQILLLFSLLFLLQVDRIYAQDQRKIKFANSLAKTGDHEAALEIFQDLYRRGNKTHPVIIGIKSAHENLGQYEDVVGFLEKVIPDQPASFNLSIDLGSAWYHLGEKDKALEIWRAVYEHKPAQQMRFRLTANAMIRLRLFEEAIEVYRTGMSELKNQKTMYLDIATLYRARLNYELATENYLNYYTSFKKKYNYVQSLILSMTKDNDATERIIAAIDEFLRQNGMDSVLKELQAGLYIKKKEYDQAFKIYAGLNKDNRSESYLMKFAQEAERNKAFEYGIKSLNLVLNSEESKTDKNKVNFILARNYYKLGKQSGQEIHVDNALSILSSIENKSTQKTVYYQSQELIGDIFQHYYEDYDQAIRSYENILKQRGSGKVASRIHLKLGHSLFMKNDLDKAMKSYSLVKKGPYLNLAHYHTARLFYFQGDFSKSDELFQALLGKIRMSDSLANNVMNYSLLISENNSDSLTFSEFARAEKLEYQHKYSEAAELYKSVAMTGNDAGIESGIRSSKLFSHVNKLEDSRLLLEDLISKNPDSDKLDEVFFILAGVYDRLQNHEHALELYRNILISYPNSFYLEDARDRARDLSAQLIQDNTP